MAIHGIANTSLVKSAKLQVISARYSEGGVSADIDNGRVVSLGALLSGERELYAATPVITAASDRVYLVRTPEVMYGIDQIGLEQFYNVADNEIRLYPLEKDDVFEVTYNNLDTTVTPAVGKYIICADGSNKWKVANTSTGSAFVGIVTELITLGYNKQNAVTIKVKANG